MAKWNEAKNILCLRLDAMGDLLMTTPAMEALKEALPGRKLTLLTSEEGAKISASIPLFEDVLVYQAPWLKHSKPHPDQANDLQMIERIRKSKFDAAVIFTVYSQNPMPSALFCYYAGIPLRAAYCRENPYHLLTDWQLEEEPHKILRHEVRRHLDLVGKLGASVEDRPLKLAVYKEERETLEMKLQMKGLSLHSPEWIVIHPGATAESRRYHARGFAVTADLLLAHTGRPVLFTGGENEKELISHIQSEMKHESINLGGALTLKEMIALLESSQLLISNNSGPVHMASALGTPVVVLYALTNPQHTPWLVPHQVLYQDVACRFCYKSVCPEGTNACLNTISPGTIFSKAMEFLGSQKARCFDPSAVNALPLPIKG